MDKENLELLVKAIEDESFVKAKVRLDNNLKISRTRVVKILLLGLRDLFAILLGKIPFPLTLRGTISNKFVKYFEEQILVYKELKRASDDPILDYAIKLNESAVEAFRIIKRERQITREILSLKKQFLLKPDVEKGKKLLILFEDLDKIRGEKLSILDKKIRAEQKLNEYIEEQIRKKGSREFSITKEDKEYFLISIFHDILASYAEKEIKPVHTPISISLWTAKNLAKIISSSMVGFAPELLIIAKNNTIKLRKNYKKWKERYLSR